METLDHKIDLTKLWRTIKAIDGRSTPKAENEAITFDCSQVTSPKQIANYFNRQFTTSKLGRRYYMVIGEVGYFLRRSSRPLSLLVHVAHGGCGVQ